MIGCDDRSCRQSVVSHKHLSSYTIIVSSATATAWITDLKQPIACHVDSRWLGLSLSVNICFDWHMPVITQHISTGGHWRTEGVRGNERVGERAIGSD